MKTPMSLAILALLTFFALRSAAQQPTPPLNNPIFNKAKIFGHLPGKMPLRTTELESLLELPVGTSVSVTVAKDFVVTGRIVSKSNPADAAVGSVVIKAINYQGSTFTFTRIVAADGTASYRGRMLNRAAGDALEIAKEGKEYVIRKRETNELISE